MASEISDTSTESDWSFVSKSAVYSEELQPVSTEENAPDSLSSDNQLSSISKEDSDEKPVVESVPSKDCNVGTRPGDNADCSAGKEIEDDASCVVQSENVGEGEEEEEEEEEDDDDDGSSSDVDVLEEYGDEAISPDDLIYSPNLPQREQNTNSWDNTYFPGFRAPSEPKSTSDGLEMAIDPRTWKDCGMLPEIISAVPLTFLLSCIPLMIMFFFRPGNVDTSLKKIERQILFCIGQEHLDAVENSEFLHFQVCMDKEGKHLEKILPELGADVKAFLIDAQTRMAAGESLLDTESKGVNVSLIVRQLEYSRVLPHKVFADSPEKLSDMREKEIAKSAFREVLEEENILKQMQEAIKSLVLAEKRLHSQDLNKPSSESGTESGQQTTAFESVESEEDLLKFSGKQPAQHTVTESFASAVSEMQRKVNRLLHENENLRNEITGAMGKESNSEFCKQSNTDNPAGSESEFEKEEIASILSFAQQIENLQNSLSEELLHLKKWNAVLQELTDNLRQQTSQKNEHDWSWEAVKENIHKIISDANIDISSRINALNELNMTEILQLYVQDRKKNFENMLNLANDYFKVAHAKTQEVLNKKMPNIVDSALNKMWDFWGGLQYTWSSIKEDLTDSVRKRCTEELIKETPRGADVTDNTDDGADDWFLKRAAEREKHRQSSFIENGINWFLRRNKVDDEEKR